MTRASQGTVIKVGGRAQQDPQLAAALAAYWTAWHGGWAKGRAPMDVCCLVHGGGDEITALQRAAGIEPTFVAGRRITRPDDIDRLRMALSGVANKRLVAALTAAGVRAVGLSGEDGPLLTADLLAGGELGAVGTVRTVDTALLGALVTAGYLPVIAPVAAHQRVQGQAATRLATAELLQVAALNVNGDDAAAAVAVALGAAELLLVSDVTGVRIDGAPIAELTPRAAERAIADGEIAGGMVAKVQAALAALAGGVARVRIGTVDILVGRESGTVVIGGAPGAATLATQGAAA